MLSTFLVLQTSVGILSRSAAFLSLIFFNTRPSSSSVKRTCLMSPGYLIDKKQIISCRNFYRYRLHKRPGISRKFTSPGRIVFHSLEQAVGGK